MDRKDLQVFREPQGREAPLDLPAYKGQQDLPDRQVKPGCKDKSAQQGLKAIQELQVQQGPWALKV